MASLDLRVNLRAFDNLSSTLERIRNGNRRLVDGFSRNREALRRLNGQLGNINAYQRHRQALNENSQSLTRMRDQVRNLHQQLRNGQAAGRSATEMQRLRQQYDRARQSVASLEATRNHEQLRLAQVSRRLREAGINTRRLGEEERRLRQEAERTNNTLQRQSEQLRRIAERRNQLGQRLALSANASMAGYVGMNAARRAGSLLANPINEYMGQEQASADLKITMMRADGSFGAFEEINRQAKELGKILPGTTQDFINLAAALKKQA